MNKLVATVILSAVLIVTLLVLAFFYVDLSGHRGFVYEKIVNGNFNGTIEVDRYVTEGKIIYKGRGKSPFSLQYRSFSEKAFLRKKDLMTIKFEKEKFGEGRKKKVIALFQENEKIDFLFLGPPEFIRLKDVSAEQDLMVFIPDDILLYMTIMEKYNFWNKGVQTFKVIVPYGEMMPPLLDEVKVEYLKDDYINIMGSKVQAESFSITTKNFPEARVFSSKYSHKILEVQIEGKGIKFVLVHAIEDPVERGKQLIKRILNVVRIDEDVFEFLKENKYELPEDARIKEMGITAGGKESVYNKNEKALVAGDLWVPEGEAGPFPAAIIVPDDGCRLSGEEYFFDSLGKYLSKAGILTFVIDYPGQDRGKDSFFGIDDDDKVNIVEAAMSFVEQLPSCRKKSISVIGYKGGGYIGCKASAGEEYVRSFILLGVPGSLIEDADNAEISIKDIKIEMKDQGMDIEDEAVLLDIKVKVMEGRKYLQQTNADLSFFLGTRLPLKEYRALLSRKPVEEVLMLDIPVLVILGKSERGFTSQGASFFKKSMNSRKKDYKMIIHKDESDLFGGIVEEDNVRVFAPGKEIFDPIVEWISKKGVYEEEIKQLKEDGPAAEKDVLPSEGKGEVSEGVI